jgi:glutamyl-Q tRNA(Asp) synthetase
VHPSPLSRRLPYVGRFAPTPSGPLHLGSLVTAMASWLDARAVEGVWLVRIEDLDTPRNVPGADQDIIATLAAFGMVADKPVTWQSQSLPDYWHALEKLEANNLVYRCTCTRREIAESPLAAGGIAVYPGTCRTKSAAPASQARGAWRLKVDDEEICFHDRYQGQICQHLARAVGDFVLRRSDGTVTYQLAVVVDDAKQGITHVVRGADLIDSTPRQLYLQTKLALPALRYWHVPVVQNQQGEKLSKQTGAGALNRSSPLPELRHAALHLGLGAIDETSVGRFWRQALLRFREQQAERVALRAQFAGEG